MINRRTLLATAAATGTAGALAACSPSASKNDSGGGKGDKKLTFRLWDETAKKAYEESFAAFTKKHGWDVTIDVVPWNDYWTKLPLDISSGDIADVYWMNSANFVQLQEAGNLLDITKVLDGGTDQWEKSVVDLYTRDGGLWGVPQLWDSIALFYNEELLTKAGIDPSTLSFDPDADSDPLREAGRALTVDGAGKHPGDDGFSADQRKQFGVNISADRQAIIGPFLGDNGAVWEKDDQYTFASPEGIAVFAYMADAVNKDKIAPSAADTNENGDFTADLFVQGKLALFQSGPYNLHKVADGVGDSFSWKLAPPIAGPEGHKSLVHGVVAVGNAKAENSRQEGITLLLEWLGSAEGQKPIATGGVAFPGNKEAQDDFLDYWKDKGQDVTVFVDAAKDAVEADTGAKANAGLEAVMPIFQEIFIGRLPAKTGLPKAQKEGNAAME